MKYIVFLLLISFTFMNIQVCGQNEKLVANNIVKEKQFKKNELTEKSLNQKKTTEIEEVKPLHIKTSLQDLQNANSGINYFIEKDGFVTLKIFNDSGEEIASLINREQKSGAYFVNYSTINLKRGIYTYKLSVNNIEQTPKLLLVK